MTTEERTGAKPHAQEDEVALLVRLADTSSPIAAERLARVRTAVHGAWRDEYVARQVKTRRGRLAVAVLFAAAASVVIALAIWGPVRTLAPVPSPVLVAHIDQITGQAPRQITGQAPRQITGESTDSPGTFASGGAVMSGSTVTTSVGTLAMTLTNGVHLRLDASSTVRVESVTDIALERGAVYVDSADAHPTQAGESPISIHTPAGLVRDIGTQFEVRLAGAGLRIRVRDGLVRVTNPNGVDARAGAGEELFSKSDGSIGRRLIAATGNAWAWAERAAPPFSAEGKSLGALLEWVSREGAWTITFADSSLAQTARATAVHGRADQLKGLTAAEVLDVVLRTCGLRYRIDGDRVVIERETSAGGTR